MKQCPSGATHLYRSGGDSVTGEREQTTIRLPAELKERLQQEADRKGISFNAIVVSIFDDYINHQS